MKKPMKFKRYDEGGEVADKEKGLKASEGEDIGFFQRLRMGNIDDPSSEAYKRFGAGRGRSERTPVNESVSVSGSQPVARPSMKPNPIFAAGERQGMRQPSGDASVAEDYARRPRNPEAEQEADNPRKTAQKPTAPKPNASKPSKAAPKLIDSSNIKSGPRFDEEGLIDPSNIRSGRREFEESQRMPTDETKLSLSERMKLSRDRSKSGSGPTDKRSVNERVRSMFGMKSGGSVSSASRRADGIATKGKTRGKIC